MSSLPVSSRSPSSPLPLQVFILLPAAQLAPGKDGAGIHEDSFDSLYMLTHNANIFALIAIDWFALLSYNFCGMSVTGFENSRLSTPPQIGISGRCPDLCQFVRNVSHR